MIFDVGEKMKSFYILLGGGGGGSFDVKVFGLLVKKVGD